MVTDDIRKLEVAVRALEGVDSKKKSEILKIIESLKSRTDSLAQSHQAIARLVEAVKNFEGAHPKLVEIVDEISQMLGRIGI